MVKFQYICALNTGSLPNCQKIPTKTYIYISSESYQEIFPIQYLDHEIRVLVILNYVNFFYQFTLSLVNFSGTRAMTETSYATGAVSLSLETCQATI